MHTTYTDETLASMIKAPSNFPTWVVRDALQELAVRRAESQPATPAGIDVLIMAEADEYDPEWIGPITLHCPHAGGDSDDIRQVDVSTRWNVVTINEQTDGIKISDGPDDDTDNRGFICGNCERPVDFPDTLADNITWC